MSMLKYLPPAISVALMHELAMFTIAARVQYYERAEPAMAATALRSWNSRVKLQHSVHVFGSKPH